MAGVTQAHEKDGERIPVRCPMCMHGFTWVRYDDAVAPTEGARQREERLVEVVRECSEALLVLDDRTWELQVVRQGLDDDATLWSWPVRRYRMMREAADRARALLSEIDAERAE